VLVIALLAALQFGSAASGELRLNVVDQTGLPLQATIRVENSASGVDQTLDTDATGALVLNRLPFGRYALQVTHPGFQAVSRLVDLQSNLPAKLTVTLTVATIATEVTVTPDATLIDPGEAGARSRIGARAIETRVWSLPGRSLPALVDTQPGWLLEANGILHPRGSEYQTMFVVDGLPLTDNRSPSFAPGFDADETRSIGILTGGYPAEYGRKLGGVIELDSGGDPRPGFHGTFAASAGSFDTLNGSSSVQYTWHRRTLIFSGNSSRTDRYLDPPVEENFSNHGTTSGWSARYEQEVGASDQFGAIVRWGGADFLVPNEIQQEAAGQRQQRSSRETAVQLSYQRVFSSNVLGEARAMLRDLGATLDSNPSSTPIIANQDRGLRDAYVRGTMTVHAGWHEIKAGGDLIAGQVREAFDYRITDPLRFDDDTPQTFAFADRADDREQSAFVQDQMHLAAWTINAGLRWDRYSLATTDSGFSPRVSAAWSWPAHDLVLRASYDRAFQTPAVENVLLASSAAVDVLSSAVVRLPVPVSRGNFYEAGASKAFGGHVRVDVSHYRRDFTNFADDDVLLNTGVSFPIAFQKANIEGTEVKLDIPRWGPIGASLAYSNMIGYGYLPITGGLLLGDEAAGALASTDRFPISQDQRHTVSARGTWQLSRGWLGLQWSYGSGLPTEFEGTAEDAIAQYGTRIASQVDFERGRVRPSSSLDASASLTAFEHGGCRVVVQADVVNLTDRLNVINFAGLFSGTALAPPRSAALRLRVDF